MELESVSDFESVYILIVVLFSSGFQFASVSIIHDGL
jgi:hypothetical protein